jgi:hypothetical protein
MSKASAMALANFKKKSEESFSDWGPAQLASQGSLFESFNNGQRYKVLIKSGVAATWIDMIGDGFLGIDIVMEANSCLVWILNRGCHCSASSREVNIQMLGGSQLVMAEAFELNEASSHGEKVSVDMQGPGCHAKLVGRWAQNKGSQLCQETLGVISKLAPGGWFEQSSKSLKLGDSKLTLLEPNLCVEIDEAKANHGAAHGGVDELSMHALMSRGLSRDVASKMVVSSFLGQAWSSSGVSAEIRAKLDQEEGALWS